MSIIVLDGITLTPALQWQERYQSQGVAQSVQRTLGGLPVIFENSLVKGAPITLVAEEVNGRVLGVVLRSVVEQLKALAEVAGAQYVLSFDGTDIPVRFRHSDPPAVDMRPVLPGMPPLPDDFMQGSIKLLTV